jgi:hypothetical protein
MAWREDVDEDDLGATRDIPPRPSRHRVGRRAQVDSDNDPIEQHTHLTSGVIPTLDVQPHRARGA